jgi:glycyl-tRNA synthetase beta chain
MTDFLLELRSEEIPARMQGKAKEDLARLFNEALAKAGLSAESVETFATPRRLALIAKGLPLETKATHEFVKGPRVDAPEQAIDGFCRGNNITRDQLVVHKYAKGPMYRAEIAIQGRNTADVLGEAIPAIIRAFPWPKSQRWGVASASTESLRWVRPLQGIVALLGDDVVKCEIDGIASGAATKGHRFHHKGDITIGSAADYIEKLRACHVIVHFSERCAIIRDGAKAAAEAAGLVLVEDEGLVAENAGLTEWPVPMLGHFDPAFLEVPQEVIQLTARVNQKYFVCHDAEGKLANAFVCTANIVANDGGAAIVAGNEKVLAARLSDAKFFWEQDLKVLLDEQAKKLSQITFHEKLGTVADKVERVAKLARWLVEEGIISSPSCKDGEGDRAAGVVEGTATSKAPPSSEAIASAATSPSLRDREDLANQAERAARLCKADLVTGMVGEFPELQGIMGGYYARAQGESDAVADAIRDHYKPVGQGDDVPTAPVTVAVSLADKFETVVALYAAGQRPTGSRDPYALRRAMIGVIRIILKNNLRLWLSDLFEATYENLYNDVFSKQFYIGHVEAFYNLFDGDQNWEIREIEDEDVIYYAGKRMITLGRASFNKTQAGWDAFIENAWPDIGPKEFALERLKVQQREAGVRHDIIDASFKVEEDGDLVRLLARVKALQAFVATDEGVNLLAGYKRAANILKSSPDRGGGGEADGGGSPPATSPEAEGPLHHPSGGPPPRAGEELALLQALDTAEPKAAAAVDAEDFEGAMAALASLRAPIDAFFEGVMVNDPDPDKRAFRLGLLARFRDAVHRVADFSKIEG